MKHTLKTLAIVAGSFLLGNYAHAQTTNTAQKADYCGTEVPSQEWEDNFQKLIKEYSSRANKTQALYTIPVVIHVIHGGEPVGSYLNLAQGQLHSQIQELNEDFAGIGYN